MFRILGRAILPICLATVCFLGISHAHARPRISTCASDTEKLPYQFAQALKYQILNGCKGMAVGLSCQKLAATRLSVLLGACKTEVTRKSQLNWDVDLLVLVPLHEVLEKHHLKIDLGQERAFLAGIYYNMTFEAAVERMLFVASMSVPKKRTIGQDGDVRPIVDEVQAAQ